MKNKILKVMKAILWLFFGFFLFIYRWKSIYSVWSYTYESRSIKSGYKKIGIFLLFLVTILMNFLTWLFLVLIF
jgi:hypothetical protein